MTTETGTGELKKRLRDVAEVALKDSPNGWWQRSYMQENAPAAGMRELSELLCFFDDEGEPRFWKYDVDGHFVETFDPPQVVQLLDALEAAEREMDKWKLLDAEAATHVESVICMRSGHFTGEPPYVGWKGLGKALGEDYDDLAKAKAALEAAERERVSDRDEINELQAKLHCMCGSPMDHSPWEGHTPVSMYDYDRSMLVDALEAAARVIAYAERADQYWTANAEAAQKNKHDILDTAVSGAVLIRGPIGRRARDWLAAHATGQRQGGDDE